LKDDSLLCVLCYVTVVTHNKVNLNELFHLAECTFSVNSLIMTKNLIISWCFDFCQKSSSEENSGMRDTDYALQKNHVMNWVDSSLIDREPYSATRWIKELQGRTTSYEPWRRQWPTQSRVQLFSWHICYLLCQEPDEEMMFTFFRYRLLVEVKTSRYN